MKLASLPIDAIVVPTVHITSYDMLRKFERCFVDVVVVDKRGDAPITRKYDCVWVSVVENPKATLKGIILSESPHSIKPLARIRETVDFDVISIDVRFRGY